MRFLEGDIQIGPVAEIRWSKGRLQRLGAPLLRARCPCEQCKMAPIPLEASMFPGLTLDAVSPVGRYALLLGFSDGHDFGAYSFDYLSGLPDQE